MEYDILKKRKKILSFIQRTLLILSTLCFLYIYLRFSIVYIESPVDIEESYLRAGYVLVDWFPHSGRALQRGDWIMYGNNKFTLGYVLESLQNEEYLIHSIHKTTITAIVKKKDIRTRILMNLVQK